MIQILFFLLTFVRQTTHVPCCSSSCLSVLKTEHLCGQRHKCNLGVQSIALHEWNLSHLREHEQNDEQEGAKRGSPWFTSLTVQS
jgi:hypothetical protein